MYVATTPLACCAAAPPDADKTTATRTSSDTLLTSIAMQELCF